MSTPAPSQHAGRTCLLHSCGVAALLLTACFRTGFEQEIGVADGSGDAGTYDSAGGSHPLAEVVVSNLQVEWTTTLWAMWAWTTDGLAGDLHAFELIEMAHRGLYEFGVDGEWSTGSLNRHDEWRLRW